MIEQQRKIITPLRQKELPGTAIKRGKAVIELLFQRGRRSGSILAFRLKGGPLKLLIEFL